MNPRMAFAFSSSSKKRIGCCWLLPILPQVLSEAHAVVLASGTLAPVDSLALQLFPSVDPGRLRHFSCGHVVRPVPMTKEQSQRALPLWEGMVRSHQDPSAEASPIRPRFSLLALLLLVILIA